MRNNAIDSFRFIAIFFVVMLHTETLVNSDTLTGALLNQVARFAVPYFFITAGFLFYKRYSRNPDTIIHQLVNYSARIVTLYVFWYLVYALWPLYSPSNWGSIEKNGISHEFIFWMKNFIINFSEHKLYFLLAGGKAFHLWFLPSLAMAIFLLAISLKFNMFSVGFTVSILFFAVALLGATYKSTPLGLPLSFEPRNGPFFSSIFVFMGAIFAKQNIKVSLPFAIVLTVAGLLLSLLEVFSIKELYGIAPYTHNYVIGTLLYAIGVFLIALSNDTFGTRYKLNEIGQLSLGIYAMHVLIMWWLQAINLWPSHNFLRVILVLALSVLIAKAFSLMPIFRKLVV